MAKNRKVPVASIPAEFWQKVQLDPTDQQFELDIHRSRVMSPEQALVLACLADAVYVLKDYKKETEKMLAIRREVRAWFESRSDGVFSFEWCCEVLGFNAEWVRKGVNEMPTEVDNRRPPVVH